MVEYILAALELLNQLLTAGIAITAFSLLLYALTFNLRDRVARSFVIILACVVIVFVGDAISSIASTPDALGFWLRLEWVGLIFLPPAYLHFSDALLATTGRPSRGRRRIATRLAYLFSLIILISLPFPWLVGSLVTNAEPAPYLERTWLTGLFTLYYIGMIAWSGVNFWRSYRRTVTSTSRRRMGYLLVGAVAPALGSYPYLLFGSDFAAGHPLFFWLVAVLTNLAVSILLVIMAYSVAFFGVSWPDRVVKRRLFKWLMRGPVTASTVLAVTTLVRRVDQMFGFPASVLAPIFMVGTLLLMEYAITLAAPIWERWLFHGGDLGYMRLLQTLDERLITSGDLRQFLESLLAAVCDRTQAPNAFIVALAGTDMDMMVQVGGNVFNDEHFPQGMVQVIRQNNTQDGIFTWGGYWLFPLHAELENEQQLLGLMGVAHNLERTLDEEQQEALGTLARRAALALQDRLRQSEVFTSLESLTTQIEAIQRLRAAARYDGTEVLTTPDESSLEAGKLSRWVKEALTHYWGGPKLTSSPLIHLRVVQKTLEEHQDNPANALRAILRQAVDQVRPEGERRFTGEWILYNILEMKFMEGHKVREIALRLAMSEADLYRKQRVAIEAVAQAILEMEERVRQEGQVELRSSYPVYQMHPNESNHSPQNILGGRFNGE
jgi:hypothetical protein